MKTALLALLLAACGLGNPGPDRVKVDEVSTQVHFLSNQVDQLDARAKEMAAQELIMVARMDAMIIALDNCRTPHR